MISGFMVLSPVSGSVLTVKSLETVWNLCLPLCLPLPCTIFVSTSLSLSKVNNINKKILLIRKGKKQTSKQRRRGTWIAQSTRLSDQHLVSAHVCEFEPCVGLSTDRKEPLLNSVSLSPVLYPHPCSHFLSPSK